GLGGNLGRPELPVGAEQGREQDRHGLGRDAVLRRQRGKLSPRQVRVVGDVVEIEAHAVPPAAPRGSAVAAYHQDPRVTKAFWRRLPSQIVPNACVSWCLLRKSPSRRKHAGPSGQPFFFISSG